MVILLSLVFFVNTNNISENCPCIIFKDKKEASHIYETMKQAVQQQE